MAEASAIFLVTYSVIFLVVDEREMDQHVAPT